MKIIDERNANRKPFVELPRGAVFEVDNDIYIKLCEENNARCDSICLNQDMAVADFDDDDRVLELKVELRILKE